MGAFRVAILGAAAALAVRRIVDLRNLGSPPQKLIGDALNAEQSGAGSVGMRKLSATASSVVGLWV